MSITSYTDFSNGLADLVVEGVKKSYPHIPEQLPLDHMPLQFVRLPAGGREAPVTADGQGGWPALICELVIVVSPVRQKRAPENHAQTLALIDALSVALRGVPGGSICKSKLTWQIRALQDIIGETEYWLIIATVAGNG